MSKAIRTEIPITVNNQVLQQGTIFRWDENKKAYTYKDKKTGKILALMTGETATNFPDQFKEVDDE